MVSYIPQRGDIVWLNFEPQTGNEITKTRTALVISPGRYNEKTNLAIFIPITSKVKNYPFEVVIKAKEIKGVALCDQVRSLDWSQRQAVKITAIDNKTIKQVLNKLYVLIGLEDIQ